MKTAEQRARVRERNRVIYEVARYARVPSGMIERWLGVMNMCGFVVASKSDPMSRVTDVLEGDL